MRMDLFWLWRSACWSEFRGDQGRGDQGQGHGDQGQHAVICLNRDNPGVREHAERQIERMRKICKKRHTNNLKRRNLGTANLSGFDKEGQQPIWEQVLQAEGELTSVTSSISTPRSVTQQGQDRGRGCGHGRPGRVIFIADVVVLAAGSPLKCTMPISIQSNLPHIIPAVPVPCHRVLPP